jgi:hypothetical protein
MPGTEKSFWQTVPGVVTAVAALITALGGLLTVLIQNDLLSVGSPRDQSPAAQPEASSPQVPIDEPTAVGPTGASEPSEPADLIPWDRATAQFVRDDGTTISVMAKTVSLACETGELKLANGQTLSLQLVDSIQFETIYWETNDADGEVSLLDGQTLTDPIYTWNCPVSGTNELGTVVVDLDDIKGIDFQR